MNQEKPDSIPVKFMPGVISTRVDESCFEISPSGKEIVFNREYNIYLINQDEKDIWTQPVLFLKSGGENSFSKDGSKIYFNSRAAVPGAKVPLNVWAAEKKDDQWGKPFYLAGTVINQTVHAPTVSANGNIYASGIIRLKFLDKAYQEPEKFTPDINGTHPFIAEDENFIIFDQPGEAMVRIFLLLLENQTVPGRNQLALVKKLTQLNWKQMPMLHLMKNTCFSLDSLIFTG